MQGNADKAGMVELDLLDRNGRVLVHRSAALQPGANTLGVDGLSGLTNGVYILRIFNGAHRHTTKLVKE